MGYEVTIIPLNEFNSENGTAKVLGILGSLRSNSLNKALLKATSSLLPSWVEFDTFDIDQIPHYNQDEEESGIPEVVREFKLKLQNADAILIASPEYNGSVTGVLKDALDWASRPYGESSFEGKPVGVMIAVSGKRGGFSALNHLALIIDYLDAKLVGEPVIVQLAHERFDEYGKLSDPEILAKIKKLVRSIIEALPHERINSIQSSKAGEIVARMPAE